MVFRGLITLALRPPCFSSGGCAFDLTDNDIAETATASPNLEFITLGIVCPTKSCRTTVSSFLFLSIRCQNLEYLEIHFNTTNLPDDLESMPENPRLRDSCTLPRCQLTQFAVSHAPLWIEEDSDYGPLVAGFLGIFPSLCSILGGAVNWDRLSSKLCDEE